MEFKIQYLGFIPITLLVCWIVYESIKDENEGMFVLFLAISFVATFFVVFGGLMWGLSAL